jgi:FMN-dependent NADH-azoreductase
MTVATTGGGPVLLRIDASVRVDGSVSRALADEVERVWVDAHPRARLVPRDLGRHPLPACWPEALAGAPEAAAVAGELVDELLAADALVLAVPMYNFGVPQQVKHWADLVITDPRARDVNRPLLPGRPAVLVTVAGGAYGPGTPRHGWDHATPWLSHLLGDLWGLDLTVVAAELTAAAADPALAHLSGEAARRRDAATAAARTAAQEVASRLRSVA